MDLVTEVVEDLGESLCRQVIQSFVNGYLQTRREEEQVSPDPVSIVIEDIAGEVSDDIAKKLVGECINEMVQSYLRQQTADDFLNTTLQPLIAEVAHLAMDDLEVENIVASMLEEYTLDTAREVSHLIVVCAMYVAVGVCGGGVGGVGGSWWFLVVLGGSWWFLFEYAVADFDFFSYFFASFFWSFSTGGIGIIF